MSVGYNERSGMNSGANEGGNTSKGFGATATSAATRVFREFKWGLLTLFLLMVVVVGLVYTGHEKKSETSTQPQGEQIAQGQETLTPETPDAPAEEFMNPGFASEPTPPELSEDWLSPDAPTADDASPTPASGLEATPESPETEEVAQSETTPEEQAPVMQEDWSVAPEAPVEWNDDEQTAETDPVEQANNEFETMAQNWEDQNLPPADEGFEDEPVTEDNEDQLADRSTPPVANQSETYTVQSGDVLSTISQQFFPGRTYAGVQAIIAANTDTLEDPNSLKVGQVLHIPSLPEAAETQTAAVAQEQNDAPIAEGEYRVQSGDTLERIARRILNNGRRWNEIYQLNTDSLSSPDRLQVGQVLKMPDGTSVPSTTTVIARPTRQEIVVASNETEENDSDEKTHLTSDELAALLSRRSVTAPAWKP